MKNTPTPSPCQIIETKIFSGFFKISLFENTYISLIAIIRVSRLKVNITAGD
jgi:hypothetical protein